MSYTPPPRPRARRWRITVEHTTGSYTYPIRATSEASARLKALRTLARDLNEHLPVEHARVTRAEAVYE